LRLFPGIVRIPDVSFFSWERFPGRKLPKDAIPQVAPDLAVEVLSRSNTPAEMDRKVHEYFAAGVKLVWYLDPKTSSVKVYTRPEQCITVPEDGTLEGSTVLPGFTLHVKDWIREAEGATPQLPGSQQPR